MNTIVSTCVGQRDLDVETFLDGLESVLKQENFSLEWFPGADQSYACWEAYRKHGMWLFITDPEKSRDIGASLARHLRTSLSWFQARCDTVGTNDKLHYQAREFTAEGKVRFIPSTNLDGKHLNEVTYAKPEDRVYQVLADLAGIADSSPSESHRFQLFRVPKGSKPVERRKTPKAVDENRIKMMIEAIEEAIVATLARESPDWYSLSLTYAESAGHTTYADPETVTEWKSRLTDEQKAKLITPGIRPPNRKFRIPPMVKTESERDVRRLLAEISGRDRLTIDVNRPLGELGLTREQFRKLMELVGTHFRIPVDEGMIEMIVGEENWNTALRTVTIRDLASFAYFKSETEHYWDRK